MEVLTYSYTGLRVESEIPFAVGRRTLAKKMDPTKCAMEVGEASTTVDVSATMQLAAAGGGIGTELPPDQEL